MRASVTQGYDYGCGIACFAFATHMTYQQATAYLGIVQSHSKRFRVTDLTATLQKSGLPYVTRHIKPPIPKLIYQEGVIVLIRRSIRYPSGHYLIRHNGVWMDPWINIRYDQNIAHALSGFRKRLPGKPMYALIPGSGMIK